MKTHDYALLSHLAALLDAGSVSGAAKRQGLSTPAMSHALSKLRERIGDPLLVRAGVGMVLTPRASQLREELPHALDRVRELLSPPASGRLRMSRPFLIMAAVLQKDVVSKKVLLRPANISQMFVNNNTL